jgi:hypothetical protein
VRHRISHGALLVIALLTVLLSAAPSRASAAPQVGIAENNPDLFVDPLFAPLHIKYTRVVLPWNAVDAAAKGDDLMTKFQTYYDRATAAGVDVLVSFEHTRGAPLDCRTKRNRKAAQCKLPSLSAYTAQVRAFLVQFPGVKTISPFNEINHPSQPTVNNPRAAAGFTNAVSTLCKQLKRACTLVVADVLDQANDPKARRPSFSKTQSYIKTFRRYLKPSRNVCGIHNYSDVNRFRDTGTKALISALGCKQYWLTETGGLYKFGASFPASQTRQARATKYMFTVAGRNKRIKRVYNFNWFGDTPGRFDAGVVSQGKPRKAYAELKKHTG